jgi:ribosomal protein S12 methylthiotransferase
MSLQRRLVHRAQKARLGERTQVLVDGPSADHDLVLRARLATQAPDIDSLVYLTECDPSTLKPGSLVDVEIVGARQYDLIARPLHG